MLSLDTPIEQVIGVGPTRAKKLQNLGLETVNDLLSWYPFRYIDLTRLTSISRLKVGEETTVKAKIVKISPGRSKYRRMALIEATLDDGTGSIQAIWYNQAFLIQKLTIGSEWIFHGPVALRPKKVLQAPLVEPKARIIPIYHETEGLNSRWFHRIIDPLLEYVEITEYLPQEIINSEKLLALPEAIQLVHCPITQLQIRESRHRLSFDELLIILLRVLDNKATLNQMKAPVMAIDVGKLQTLVNLLPFKLTNAQRKTAWTIIQDLAKSQPMNRLLQGDVGSGKTVVGALAVLVTQTSGYQSVWLAPTEILAKQHYQTLVELLNPLNIQIGLWTGSVKAKEQKDVWVGTHALLSENAPLENVGLVIVDEQHRFGVQQRAKLRKFQYHSRHMPHFLSMTATPIPRTLALTLYGDLDVSVIDEMPPGRQKIITRVIPPKERTQAYDFLRSQIDQGRQIYVVTPLIEEPTHDNQRLLDLERKSAIKEYDHLSKEVFPKYRIGLMHGKLRPKEKQKVMDLFKNHELDVLVSTTVIEVGIDVPNATVMMIEDAERFGLAQLHQLRGRVGRGQHQSYCFLFAGLWNNVIAKRLKAMERNDSGFQLAEIDLQLRGPGELVGIRQSGMPDLKMASLTDTLLIEKVRRVAQNIINEGLDKYPTLQKKLTDTFTSRHLE